MSDNLFDVWISSIKFWIDILSFIVILIYVNGGSLIYVNGDLIQNQTSVS